MRWVWPLGGGGGVDGGVVASDVPFSLAAFCLLARKFPAAFVEKAIKIPECNDNDAWYSNINNIYNCSELGWKCIPLVCESYGCESLFTSSLAICGNTDKSKVLADLNGHLSLTLVRANARAILARSYTS